MNRTVYSYVQADVFTLKVTGRNEGRYERYCRRIGKEQGGDESKVEIVEPTGKRKQGYADIYATWAMLQKTIDASKEEFDTGHRPISALYEFWCFLKGRECEKTLKKVGWWLTEMLREKSK